MARSKTPKKRPAQRTMSLAESSEATSRTPTPSSSRAGSAQPASRANEQNDTVTDDQAQKNNDVSEKPLSALPLRMQPVAGQKRRLPTSSTGRRKGDKGDNTEADETKQDEPDISGTDATPRRTKTKQDNKGKQRQTRDTDDQAETEVQGDFSDLFVIDTTPSAVPRQAGDDEDATDDKVDATDKIKQFTEQVYVVSSEDESDSDDDNDEDESAETTTASGNTTSRAQSRNATVDAEMSTANGDIDDDDSFEMPQELRGTIVDDSAAKVTGRYYKEADLTKSCALCGERGHSSRECEHSQCFVCGAIDSEHEARHCPVMLVCAGCGSRGHFVKNCPSSNGRRAPMHQKCSLCPSTLHMTANCPTLWRIYDRKGAKPSKRSIVLACANDGTTKDHFIDDCYLPRGHPIRVADPSAFNRAALGDAASRAPQPSLGPGGASGKMRRQAQMNADRQRMIDNDNDVGDDDWFASRSRAPPSHGSSGGRHNKSSRGGSSRDSPVDTRGDRFAGGRGPGGKSGKFARANAAKKADGPSHFRFGDSLKDRFTDSTRPGSSGGGGREWGRPSPRDDDRRGRGGGGDRQSLDYGDRRQNYADDDRRDRDRPDSARKHGGNGGGTPSLASRMGPRPAPRYQGGYF
ncbi:hypothetical protein ACM66B_001025 [Microbotryomycetes sp. NB124-2]